MRTKKKGGQSFGNNRNENVGADQWCGAKEPRKERRH